MFSFFSFFIISYCAFFARFSVFSVKSPRHHRKQRGFTLLELLIVVSLIAIASGAATLALRDSQATALEREADRVAAMLEAARTQSRSSGLAIVWSASAEGFEIVGAGQPSELGLEAHTAQRGFTPWLAAGTSASLNPEPTRRANAPASALRTSSLGANHLVLGPEPIIAAQSLRLQLGERSITLATDGLRPFAVVTAEQETAK